MNPRQWSRRLSSGQQGPVYSQALAHPPLGLLVCTTCLYTESADHSQESAGGPGEVWWERWTGVRFLTQALLFSIPVALGISPHFLEPLVSHLPKWTHGSEDWTVEPRPGWGLSFLSHLSGCYVYTALSPSSWGERLVSTPYPTAGPATDRPAEEELWRF